jgi:aspartate/methionine/tyrosine aminotransferase
MCHTLFMGQCMYQVPPSLWAKRGGYDKVVCTGGLSKSFGLSGLRCGWLVAPPELLQVCMTKSHQGDNRL